MIIKCGLGFPKYHLYKAPTFSSIGRALESRILSLAPDLMSINVGYRGFLVSVGSLSSPALLPHFSPTFQSFPVPVVLGLRVEYNLSTFLPMHTAVFLRLLLRLIDISRIVKDYISLSLFFF